MEPSDIVSPRTTNPAFIGYASPSCGSVSETRIFLENAVEEGDDVFTSGSPHASINKSKMNNWNNVRLEDTKYILFIYSSQAGKMVIEIL